MPRRAVPAEAARHGHAAAPSLRTRPPDHQARRDQHERSYRTAAVEGASGFSCKQVVVQIEQRRDELQLQRRLRAEQQLVAVDEHAAGDADHQDVQTDADAGPEVNVKQRAADRHGIIERQPNSGSNTYQTIAATPAIASATRAKKSAW